MSQLGYTPLFGGSRGYTRSITIDHTKCGTADSISYPVLVSISNSTMKSRANGGHVYRNDGFDIGFYSNSNCTTLLPWEVEYYDPIGGTLIAWVRIATVSHTTDTTFYMNYGKSNITTFLGNTMGSTWNSNFVGVWHLANPTGSTITVTDSSAAVQTTANNSVTATTGKIDGAGALAGSSYLDVTGTASLNLTSNWTYSIWMKTTSTGTDSFFSHWQSSTTQRQIYFYMINTGVLKVDVPFIATIQVGTTAVNTGAWNYVSATKNGTTWKVYVNGVVDNTVTAAVTQESCTIDLFIGIDTGLVNGFNGSLDEARVNNTDVGASWLLTDYNNQNNPGNISSPGFLTFGNEF